MGALTARRAKDLSLAVAGTFLVALSYAAFFDPAKVAPGGFTGLAIALSALARARFGVDVPLWAGNAALNVPLLLVAGAARGWKSAAKAIAATLAVSAWLFVLPSGGFWAEDLFVTASFGGAVMGFGLGLCFLANVTTGGTDTLAATLKVAFPWAGVPRLVVALDAGVVAFSAFVFGARRAAYAVVAVVVVGAVSDRVTREAKNAYLAFVVSDRHEEVAAAVMRALGRGATFLHGAGAYGAADKEVLMCAIPRRQAASLKDVVREADPDSFLVLADATEVRGLGFLGYDPEEF